MLYRDGEFISVSRSKVIDFLFRWSKCVEGDVLDIGCGRWDLPRRLFGKTSRYIACDTVDAPNVDVICDVAEVGQTFGLYAFDAVICTSLLEHLEEPRRAIDEIRAVLRPGGLLLLSVPFRYPIHGTDRYKDYWRFTLDGLMLLLSGFEIREVIENGPHFSPFNYCIAATKPGRPGLPSAQTTK